MFVEERQAKILDILKKRQVESVYNLSKELFISETSIRRDLGRLEKLGFVKEPMEVRFLFKAKISFLHLL